MNKQNKNKVAKRPYQKKQVEPLSFGPLPRYLTKEQVSQMLSVTGRYVNQLVAAGRLNAFRVSHRIVRYRLSDVEALLDGSETTQS
jgi:excisionase family DNA binding protein